ncbi:MAG: DUF2145 domain-containing protein [Comamonadaceae bacterium]|nr:DUF2145 domain-containing protein [Comamonadaceae bacterium]
MALIARSGLDLRRFEMRYSHAGVSLKASPETPWAVRQLYYACDEKRAAHLRPGHVGLPDGHRRRRRSAMSRSSCCPPPRPRRSNGTRSTTGSRWRCCAGTYSANAYPFSTRYQNCNQWVMELLASAWGALTAGGDLAGRGGRCRPAGAPACPALAPGAGLRAHGVRGRLR